MTPKKVAAIPRKTLSPVYITKWKKSPSRNSARFSLAKVEKVVNPPQKPTVRNIFHPGVKREVLSEKPYINPMSRHPEILTKKVPKGKAEGKLFCMKRDARNLEILPRNPPVPINNNVLIIINSNTYFYHKGHKIYHKVTQEIRENVPADELSLKIRCFKEWLIVSNDCLSIN